MSAVQRGRSLALRFQQDSDGYGWSVYVDGNGNGVRTADIDSGADPLVTGWIALGAIAPGVDRGAPAGVPPVDSTALVGDDPVRLGPSDLLSFSPDGQASSGTLYITGRGDRTWAVRVLGATGRIRMSRFDTVRGLWVTP